MTDFLPENVTDSAHEIARRYKINRMKESGDRFEMPRNRSPIGASLEPKNEYHKIRVVTSDPKRLTFGPEMIDLSDVEQLTETAQTRAIGKAILYARQVMDGNTDLIRINKFIMDEIQAHGLDILDPDLTGNLARFRPQEFAATLNRIRSLKFVQIKGIAGDGNHSKSD